jgi:hypothetical protein
MRVRIAKKVLRLTDVVLEKALRGRARLALYVEFKTQPTKSVMVQRMAKELGLKVVGFKPAPAKSEETVECTIINRPDWWPRGWRFISIKGEN